MIKNDDCWIKYLDDDDIMLQNCLQDVNGFIQDKDVDVITTDFKILDDNNNLIKIVYPNYLKESVFNGNLDTCCICHKYSLFKK